MNFPKSEKHARYWKIFTLNQIKKIRDEEEYLTVLEYHNFFVDFSKLDFLEYKEELIKSIKIFCETWLYFIFLLNEFWENFYKSKNNIKELIKDLKNSIKSIKIKIYIPEEGQFGRTYILNMIKYINSNIKEMFTINTKEALKMSS